MKRITLQKKKTLTNIAMATAISLACMPLAFAGHCHCKHHHKKCCKIVTTVEGTYKDAMPVYIFVPNWYVGGHIGVGRTHDKRSSTANSVTQIGPGWTADLGYKFATWKNAVFAGEMGYTQYRNSTEDTRTTNVAKTEHFAAYAALVGEYPLVNDFTVLGKLGIAYSYAKKIFNTAGSSASGNTYSPYYGLGASYYMTPKAALVLQWARVRGNGSTGSTDLTSLGVTYNFLA